MIHVDSISKRFRCSRRLSVAALAIPLFVIPVVVSQAITDSLAGQKPRVMGYDTPR